MNFIFDFTWGGGGDSENKFFPGVRFCSFMSLAQCVYISTLFLWTQ